MSDLVGLPPIEVYELGGVYFVQDGHHRVSVARQSGTPSLQAYVTKVESRVSLPPEADPEDVILRAEYSEFLHRTRLDELRPGSDLSASVPGQYRKLLEHIDVHRYFMGLDEERPIPYEEAVTHWYDHVYHPVVDVIRAQGILQDFPRRTEADLYLWVAEHREELKEALGWDVDTAAAAEDLAEQFGNGGPSLVERVGATLVRAVVPRDLPSRPRSADWHQESLPPVRDEQLFRDILVAIDGRASGWRALEQTRRLSLLEDLRVHGLHVLPPGPTEEHPHPVSESFAQRLERMGLRGELTTRSGEVADEIADLARWTDLVILGLNFPPEKRPVARVGSGIRGIISHSPRPVLLVPGDPSPLDSAVLAYDGSPKAEEAKFVAAYAAGRWGVDLTVVMAQELGKRQSETLKAACRYLGERGIEATMIAAKGEPGQAILEAVESADANLILMGGYGFGPVLELVLGSTVHQVLRETSVPVLICS
jgi:nucleotide-binding universal stress UspA family protein